MPAVTAKTKRENLFQEISNVLRQWPELERRIFSLAHFRGQSPEAISRSFQLDVEEVSGILKQCERRLHDSLRNFRKSGYAKPSAISAETACAVARGRDLNGAHALASRANNNILDTFRKSA